MPEAEVQEIYCKTLLNKVDVPGLPFRWTLNPYRGCRHACRYCYARPTHEFWGMNAGKDFDQRVFAKINAPEVLRRELSRPKWRGETIAIGTASDPYEPAEAQYCLTRRILQVLAEFHNPVFITTKGVLVKRDVDVLAELNRARSLAELYRDEVIPEARAMVESAFSSYRVGTVDFLTLVDAQMTVNRYEGELYTLLGDYGRAFTALESAIGRALPRSGPSLTEAR